MLCAVQRRNAPSGTRRRSCSKPQKGWIWWNILKYGEVRKSENKKAHSSFNSGVADACIYLHYVSIPDSGYQSQCNQLILVFQIWDLVGALVWLRHVAATSSFQLRLLLTIGLPSFCEGLCIGISAAAGCIAWSRCFLLWSRFLCCSGNSLDSSTATSRWHANASSATRTLGLSWHMIIHDYLTERIGMDCLVHHGNEA